jgi:predicted DNA-binding transcriptional regulator AlpA
MSQEQGSRVKTGPSVAEAKRRKAQRQRPKPAHALLAEADAPVLRDERAPDSAAETLSHAQRSRPPPPRFHHLDKRAAGLLTAPNGDGHDDLLTTRQVSAWLNVSTQWLDIGRHRGYGPHYIRMSQRCVRYKRGDVLDWLEQRTRASTMEYEEKETTE